MRNAQACTTANNAVHRISLTPYIFDHADHDDDMSDADYEEDGAMNDDEVHTEGDDWGFISDSDMDDEEWELAGGCC